MFETLEIRWFWWCSEPGAAIAWFVGCGEGPEPEQRTDTYLLLPGCETVGVKLREERFEIKALLRDDDGPGPADGPQGIVQHWIKWSLTSCKLPCPVAEMREAGCWQAVPKHRFQRPLGGPAGKGTTGSEDSWARSQGCNVELTCLESGPEAPCWVTLGFEAYGPREELPELLYRPVERFWREQRRPPAVRLTAENSFGYPGWLNRFQGH